jgi:hypothetical protein
MYSATTLDQIHEFLTFFLEGLYGAGHGLWPPHCDMRTFHSFPINRLSIKLRLLLTFRMVNPIALRALNATRLSRPHCVLMLRPRMDLEKVLYSSEEDI